MRILAVALLLIAVGLGWRSNLAGCVGTWWQQRGSDAISQDAMEDGLFTGLMAAHRSKTGALLLPDARLRDWLRQHLSPENSDVSGLTRDLQEAFPEYQQIAALQAWQPTGPELAARLADWPELGSAEHTHMTVAAQPSQWNLGWKAVVILGQRLPVLTPEALAQPTGDLYYTECSLCGKGQSCEIQRHSRSLALECSHCRRIYAMMASGSDGRFRYVNEFLTGYAPPAHYSRTGSKLAELMSIWRAVSTNCRYVLDTGTDDNDAWQTARETQVLGQGDCEDSAILLADWLLTRGFEARVALGRYAERGGHAWVVVRLDGEVYLLESTSGAGNARKPPLLSEVGSRYVPEILFDRDACYTRVQPNALWNGDFWSSSTWVRIAPREVKAP